MSTENTSSEKKKITKKEVMRAVKFTLFSISAGVIQMVSSLLLRLVILEKFIPADATIFYITELNKNTFIADTIGLALSVLWNFTFNRKFTFKAANNVPIAMLLAFVFYIPFYHFQIWYIDVVEKGLASIGDWGFVIALGTCMIINFVLEFLWQNFVVFRGAVDTNKLAEKEKLAECASTTETESEDTTVEVSTQKLEVDVILKSTGDNAIAVIKVLRKELNLDLQQAKQLAENTPVTIAESRLTDEAKMLAQALTEVGATVELK